MPDNILEEYNIDHGNRHDFTTYQKFRSFLQKSYTTWRNGGPQYIAVLGVTRDVLSQIDQNRFKLPRMRLYHDASFERLIIKFVGSRHEIVVREFTAEFMEHCQAIGITRYDLYTIGPGRKASVDTNRSKEPDEAFRPKNTRTYEACYPTLCIEVGRSESLNQLRNDARFWLTHTDRQVRVVILIHIQADNKMLHIEHWEMVQRSLSRTREDAMPTNLQEFDLCLLGDGTVSANPPSASLDIATELLFDIVPHCVTKDTVTIAPNRLIAFAHEYFRTSK